MYFNYTKNMAEHDAIYIIYSEDNLGGYSIFRVFRASRSMSFLTLLRPLGSTAMPKYPSKITKTLNNTKKNNIPSLSNTR